MRFLLIIAALAVALAHAGATQSVQRWQERQSQRIACNVAVTTGDDTLISTHCQENR